MYIKQRAASTSSSVQTSNGLTENRLANIKTMNSKIISNILLYAGRNKYKGHNLKGVVPVIN
jgi:hypothetical protein